jgi:putative chitinase
MDISAAKFKQIMPNAVKNVGRNPHFSGYTFEQILIYITRYAREFEINTPLRWAHYLAQIAHESAELRYSEEIASGKAYDTGKLAIKLGNTPEADGDGQKYKGRGLIQLTGRSNYEAYKKYCGFDVVKQPELLAKPVGAIRSSMWFWKSKGLNELADRDEFVAISKRINGGTNGIEDRRKYLARAKRVLVHNV